MVLGADKMNGVKLVDFDVHGNKSGYLIALESLSEQIPFEVKRVYYIFGVNDNSVRGKHAHYQLKQLLICVNGSIDITVEDGKTKELFRLDNPSKGLYIEGFIWREMKNFSQNAVLVVLASEHYSEADYVRDYEKFKREVLK